MEISSLLVMALLTVFVIGYLALPLYQNTSSSFRFTNKLISGLLAERDRVLDTLLELDLDYEMGKIAESNYQSARTRLVSKGGELMKSLEDLEQEYGLVDDNDERDDDLEKLISKRKKSLNRK